MQTTGGLPSETWCDNCGMEPGTRKNEPRKMIRWRRRNLCPTCAETAVKDSIRTASMMLGHVARMRAEDRKRKKAESERERRLLKRAKDLAKLNEAAERREGSP